MPSAGPPILTLQKPPRINQIGQERSGPSYCTFLRSVSCNPYTFLMTVPCRFRQILQDESDRFHQLNTTGLAKIAKVYGITARTSLSELVKQVLLNQIGAYGTVPSCRKRRNAESQKRRKAQKGDFIRFFAKNSICTDLGQLVVALVGRAHLLA